MINWQEIEDLGLEAKQLATMALTIEDAMSYGPSSAETYLDTLSLLTILIHQHATKINNIAALEVKNDH